MGIAATGSGKTLAFGLPALKHILAQREAGVFTGPALLSMHPQSHMHCCLQDIEQLTVGSLCGIRNFGGRYDAWP